MSLVSAFEGVKTLPRKKSSECPCMVGASEGTCFSCGEETQIRVILVMFVGRFEARFYQHIDKASEDNAGRPW